MGRRFASHTSLRSHLIDGVDPDFFSSLLALDWVEALQFGVVVSEENRASILEQLEKLRGWFASNEPSQLERLELLVYALKAVRFDHGQTAWIG